MTVFKKYLGYRLKKAVLPTLAFSLIALAITSFYARVSADGFMAAVGPMGIESLATIMGVIASIIPMLETARFKSRRNIDTLWFLPLSRFKMALVHYLSGLFQVFIIYTVAFVGHFLCLLDFSEHFKLQYMPLYYVLLLLLGVIVYSVFIFLFGEANGVADGVMSSALWIFALYAAVSALGLPIKLYAVEYIYGGYNSAFYAFAREYSQFSAWFIPFAPINNLTVVFQSVMQGWKNYNDCEIYWPTFAEAINRSFKHWYMVFPWIAAGIASTWGYFRTFCRKGAEKAGDISGSAFCYKTLIPIYGASLIFMSTEGDGFTFFLTVAAMYIGYSIYRRSFRIPKSDIVTILSVIAGSIAFMLLTNGAFS